MRRAAIILPILLLSASTLFGDQMHQLEKIIVTPSRMAVSARENARSLTVLDDDALGNSVYSAISDAIGNVGGIDIRRRGPEGVQADINIRGATFEENMVLIDGVRVNDPQTGHHNMDLPITMADIDRIEILKGPASSLYGANSFGGVINIVTKKPEAEKAVISSQGGSHNFFQGALSLTFPSNVLKNRFSFDGSRSSGYMSETEFNIISLSNTTVLETPSGDYNFLFGYMKKDFGADSFYSNLFSNEEEHTDTRFFKIDSEIESNGLKMTPRLFLRRHWDKFALDRNRPGWQTNYHTTYDYGGGIDFILENNFADVAYGFELSRDKIDSTNIQTHKRDNQGIYAEISPHLFDDLYINIGLREDHFSVFGWQYSPSASVSYAFAEYFKLRSSIGRAYRVPTFTDLYYGDAANIGNSNLRPESAWSYEAGLDFKADAVDISATYFHRDSDDTIDWTRTSSRNPWQASNIGSIDTNGVEVSINVRPKEIYKPLPIESIFLDYTALDQYRKHDYLSKYALDYLKQHMTGGIICDLLGFRNYWVLNYKKRIGKSGFIVVDMKVTKDIAGKGKMNLQAFFEIENLFDTDYSEQSDIPMPGQWIRSGARLEF